MDDETPRRIAGRYRLLARLGAGGMGTVWRAHDEVLDREVAVKEVTFPPGLSEADQAVLRERTRREARAAARLDHPSAVTVYDVVEQDGSPFLVLELVESRTLADVVRSDGPLTPPATAQVGLALLGALRAAHAQGILHRDVKPSNVLVRDDGRVVLTDFGIATSTGDATLTHTGLLLGSPAYIAPERARGEAPGPPSDLWSLGATLFTAVEGRPPFEGDTPMTTVMAVVTGEPAPFVAAGPLEPVLRGLLAREPADRPDAAQAARMLEQVAGQTGAAPTQVLPVPALPKEGAASRTAALPSPAAPRSTAPPPPAVPPPPATAPPRPAPPRPARAAPAPEPARRPRWAVPVAVGALLLALAGGAVALNERDDGSTSAAGAQPSADPATSPRPSPTAGTPAPAPVPADPAPEPSVEPSVEPSPVEPAPSPSDAPAAEPGSADLPAGWTADEGDGWTVALPPGFAQTRAGEYRDAGTGRTLRVETGRGQPDAVADRERAAAGFAQRHPTYRQVRLEPVDYRGYEAADWEFTYEGLHVVNRVFVVDGTGHSLWLQTRADDGGSARADLEAIAAAFTPA